MLILQSLLAYVIAEVKWWQHAEAQRVPKACVGSRNAAVFSWIQVIPAVPRLQAFGYQLEGALCHPPDSPCPGPRELRCRYRRARKNRLAHFQSPPGAPAHPYHTTRRFCEVMIKLLKQVKRSHLAVCFPLHVKSIEKQGLNASSLQSHSTLFCIFPPAPPTIVLQKEFHLHSSSCNEVSSS